MRIYLYFSSSKNQGNTLTKQKEIILQVSGLINFHLPDHKTK